jgi:hypothetical protein
MFEYNIPKVLNGANRKGLYANYPFNDLNPDPFISKFVDAQGNPQSTYYENKVFRAEGTMKNYEPNNLYLKNKFTFHSPDTMFSKPFLADDELKIYGESWGVSNGSFVEPRNHPKHKFVTDLAFGIGVIYGIGYAISKITGTKDISWDQPTVKDDQPLTLGMGSTNAVGIATAKAATATYFIVSAGLDAAENLLNFGDGLSGQTWGLGSLVYAKNEGLRAGANAIGLVPGAAINSSNKKVTYKDQDRAPGLLRAVSALQMFTHYTGEGADALLTMVKALNKYRRHALRKLRCS